MEKFSIEKKNGQHLLPGIIIINNSNNIINNINNNNNMYTHVICIMQFHVSTLYAQHINMAI